MSNELCNIPESVFSDWFNNLPHYKKLEIYYEYKAELKPLYLSTTEEGYPEYIAEIKDKINEIINYINRDKVVDDE